MIDKRPDRHSAEENDGLSTKREAQQPAGPVDGDNTWLSGEDEHDPQREEAAERARRAVEPGRPRE